MPTQIQHTTVKTVEIEPESDVPVLFRSQLAGDRRNGRADRYL